VRFRRCVSALAGIALGGVTLALVAESGASADARDAGAPDASKVIDRSLRIPPDPVPLSERMQWVFDLRWQRGEVYLVQVHQVDMGPGAHPTPRVMGRFALELYEGPTLIERARFDFPMLGAYEPPDAGFRGPPRFEPGLTTRIGVFFPATKRGTRLELWDRATDRRWPLPWPPVEASPGARDASAG
jgi:hypothetical protein